jgi:hypothetical protein
VTPRRREQLVVIAEFADRAAAEEAWARLVEADIPANVLTDPGALGGDSVARVQVAREHVADAQRLIVDLV